MIRPAAGEEEEDGGVCGASPSEGLEEGEEGRGTPRGAGCALGPRGEAGGSLGAGVGLFTLEAVKTNLGTVGFL